VDFETAAIRAEGRGVSLSAFVTSRPTQPSAEDPQPDFSTRSGFLAAACGGSTFLVPQSLVVDVVDEPALQYVGDGWWEAADTWVFDPRSTLGLGPGQAGTRLVIRILATPRSFGILVDHTDRQREVHPQALHPVAIPHGIIAGLAKTGERTAFPVLDLGAIAKRAPTAFHLKTEAVPAFSWPRPGTNPRLAASITVDPDRRQVLLFPGLTDESRGFEVSFGLSASQVLEIVAGQATQPLPFAPRGTVGLLTWRSLPITVVDIGAVLKLTPKLPSPPARVVIARSLSGDQLLGFAIEEQTALVDAGLVHRPWSQPLSAPLELILGAYNVDGDLLIVPNCDALCRPESFVP
jgi:chemotaxis signal transduction protein